MSKIQWEDMTSYAKGERGKIPPTVLKVRIKGIVLLIHRHIYYPGTWLLSCQDLNIKNEDLETDDFNTAESNMLCYLSKYMKKYCDLRHEILKLQNTANSEHNKDKTSI